jgi:hypothetical protein
MKHDPVIARLTAANPVPTPTGAAPSEPAPRSHSKRPRRATLALTIGAAVAVPAIAIGALVGFSGRHSPTGRGSDGGTAGAVAKSAVAGAGTVGHWSDISYHIPTPVTSVARSSNHAVGSSPIDPTVQEPPKPVSAKYGTVLVGVSCTSATACVAVGYFENTSSKSVPLAETWDGTSWSLHEPATPASAKDRTLLEQVSCTSSTACTAVGSYVNSSGVTEPLAERWDGTTWTIQATPVPAGATGTALFGVSCPSATACTAVGLFHNGAVTEPLAETWNGTSWTVQEPPAVGEATFNKLNEISCTSPTECTAVGYSFKTPEYEPLAERWNGTAWSIQTTPAPATADGMTQLESVSCASPEACVAVGWFGSSNFNKPLAERWNGAAWTLEELTTPPTPAEGSDGNRLTGVSCASSEACVATGIFVNSSKRTVPLAESWNGTAWTAQEPPSPTAAEGSALGRVSCTAAEACTAVGDFRNAPSSGSDLPQFMPLADRFE